MRKSAFWLLASSLLVAVLILVACGSKTPINPTTASPTTQTTQITTSKPPTTSVAPATTVPSTTVPATTVQKPQYGGTINVLLQTDILGFDRAASNLTGQDPSRIINEGLVNPDWARGPAGTNEIDWAMANQVPVPQFYQGDLAESVQFPKPGTAVYKIRQGVRWALSDSPASKLVGGREMTADDIVWGLKYYATNPKGFVAIRNPPISAGAKITKTGPWEVTITFPPELSAAFWKVFGFSDIASCLVPPEVVQKYGDQNDWHNVVGTGPFMLTDFVSASSMTLSKNPNYWMKDPVGPGKGNQLPYIDMVKYLIIPDISTQMAAMRTAKGDWMTNVNWEDANNGLIKIIPQMQYLQSLPRATHVIFMRTDKPNLPYSNLSVRQALTMAIDFNAIKNDLYNGNADILVWPQPTAKGKAYAPYVPLEKLHPAARDLFTYNPTKAKQMLTQAGYPKGFEATVICSSVGDFVDVLSVVKAMWAKVDVDLKIQPLEAGIYQTRFSAGNYDNLMLGQAGTFAAWSDLAPLTGVANNKSFIKDSKIDQVIVDMSPYILTDPQKAIEIVQNLFPYVIEQAYAIGLPEPYKATVWWPWVKNYHGEVGVVPTTLAGWTKYVWLDQNLKKQLTGR